MDKKLEMTFLDEVTRGDKIYYVCFYRGIPQGLDTDKAGSVTSTLGWFRDKNNPETFVNCYLLDKKMTDIVEKIIASENKATKTALKKWIEFASDVMLPDKKIYMNAKCLPALEDIYYNESKLAQARNGLAKKIDKALGTNLKEKKLPTFLKKNIEKPLSKAVDKIISNKKVKE